MIDKSLTIDNDPLGTITALTPSSDLVDVILPTGVIWQFRPIVNNAERRDLGEKISKYVDAARDKKSAVALNLKAKKVEIPADDEDLRAAYEIHLRAANPSLPVDVAFKLVNAPETFVYIVASLEAADKTFRSVLHSKHMEELRKKSETTPDTPSDSQPSGDFSPVVETPT